MATKQENFYNIVASQHPSNHHHHHLHSMTAAAAASRYPFVGGVGDNSQNDATSSYNTHHHLHQPTTVDSPNPFYSAFYATQMTQQQQLQQQQQQHDSGSNQLSQHSAAAIAAAAAIHQSEIDIDPRELEAFAEKFKQRRIKLGVTQADVGQQLSRLKLPGVGSLSQSTICRFESLTLSHNNMIALKPVLHSWLEQAEAEARNKRKSDDSSNNNNNNNSASINTNPAASNSSSSSSSLLLNNINGLISNPNNANLHHLQHLHHANSLNLTINNNNSSHNPNSNCSNSSSCSSSSSSSSLNQHQHQQQHSSSSNNNNNNSDRKRKRTSIAAPEKRSLETYFAIQPRPSGEKIAQIAEKLDLKKNVVRVWFCNQRQKQKRMKFAAIQGLEDCFCFSSSIY